MSESIIERLAMTAPDLEVWWDSSPLIYRDWVRDVLKKAPDDKRMLLTEQLLRFFNPDNPSESFMRGVTTNPPISLAAMKSDPAMWSKWIADFRRGNPKAAVEEVFWSLYKEIVQRGAEMLMPLFESSGYRFGYLSGQMDPRNLHDIEKMLLQGKEIAAIAPNVMVKVPGSAEGIQVLRQLTAEGIATNCTMGYVVPQYIAVAEAVQEGLLEARRKGVDLTRWRSVVTAMNARWENHPIFEEQAEQAGIKLNVEYKRWASLAIFKHAYRIFRQRAYPSKMLICSVRPGPTVKGVERVWHIEEVAGAGAVFTLPPGFLADMFLKFNEPGQIEFEPRIWKDIPEAVMSDLRRIPYFVQGYEENGMTIQEFNSLPPLQSTFKEFSAATEEMVSFVRENMK